MPISISLGLKLAAIMAAKKATLYGVAWVSFHLYVHVNTCGSIAFVSILLPI